MSSKRCIVYRCNRRGGYRLPVANELRSQWLTAIRWSIPLEPKKTAIICPTHFKDGDFEEVLHNGREKKYLKRDAVPSIFPWNSDKWPAAESSDEPSTEDGTNEDEDVVAPSSSSSSSSSSSEGEESDPEDVVLISSDEKESKSPARVSTDTNRENLGNSTSSGLEESSPACQSAKRPNSSPNEELLAKRGRVEMYTSSSQCSSDSSPLSSPISAEDGKIKPEMTGTPKDDVDSDCVICEEPVENIDLTKDDEPLEPISPSAYQLSWSDDESANSEMRAKIRGWVNDILAKKKSHVEPISDSEEDRCEVGGTDDASESSDCEIVERVHPMIHIESDENSDDLDAKLMKREPKLYEEVINLDSDDDNSSPTKTDTSLTMESLSTTPNTSDLKELATGSSDTAALPTVRALEKRGDTSPEASKDPNGPVIAQASVSSQAVKQKADLPPSKKRSRKILLKVCSAKQAVKLSRVVAADYRLVKRPVPGSKDFRFFLKKKKKNKATLESVDSNTPNPSPGEEMEVSVDPMTATLHLDAPKLPKAVLKPALTDTGATYERIVKVPNLVHEEHPCRFFWLCICDSGAWGCDFTPHCRQLVQRLSRVTTDAMSKISEAHRKMVPSSLNMSKVYEQQFEPKMSYGIIYWGHSESADSVFKEQKGFMSLFSWRGKSSSEVTPRTFRTNNILTLPSTYILHCLIHAHRSHSIASDDSFPPYMTLGAKFYEALPVTVKALPMDLFIKTVKNFLIHNGFFNVARYYVEVKKWDPWARRPKF